MNAKRRVDEYLDELAGLLNGVPERSRVLAEVSDHLHEALEHERAAGCAENEAVRRAITRCGEPAVVVRPFLRHPPVYIDSRVRPLVVIALVIAAFKALVLVTVSETISAYDLDDDIELRRRAIWFIGLFVTVGMGLLGRWTLLQRRGVLVEVSSTTPTPTWHRRARRWLIASALLGYCLALLGLWAPGRWMAVTAVLIGFTLPVTSFAVVRHRLWRRALA